MSRIIYLMGKSSTGKDTIYKRLLKKSQAADDTEGKALRLRTIVTYTTRPIRVGEHDGVEYHFTDEDGYRRIEASGRVIEHREYQTVQGLWRYFTVDDGQFDLMQNEYDYLMIGTLESYCSMKTYFGEDRILPVLIESEDGVRLQRAMHREQKQEHPHYEEMCRRFLADSADFAPEKLEQAGVVRRFYNNEDLEQCLEEIVQYILQ